MANHTTYTAWPVSCKVCAGVTTANFKQSPLICQICKSSDVTPPTDPGWWNGDGNVIESWPMSRRMGGRRPDVDQRPLSLSQVRRI